MDFFTKLQQATAPGSHCTHTHENGITNHVFQAKAEPLSPFLKRRGVRERGGARSVWQAGESPALMHSRNADSWKGSLLHLSSKERLWKALSARDALPGVGLLRGKGSRTGIRGNGSNGNPLGSKAVSGDPCASTATCFLFRPINSLALHLHRKSGLFLMELKRFSTCQQCCMRVFGKMSSEPHWLCWSAPWLILRDQGKLSKTPSFTYTK